MPFASQEQKREYQRRWLAGRRAEFFDGKVCSECFSCDFLELHHKNPDKKEDHRVWSWSGVRREVELNKCVVLCRECHAKTRLLDMKHGTLSFYKGRRCRCILCKKANANYELARTKGQVSSGE